MPKFDFKTGGNMSVRTLEQRVELLESQVADLLAELHQIKSEVGKDWRRTIGIFTDNEGMKELLRETMRLREVNRREARLDG